ncbi:MAG: Smr/MutS family protein [Spirochaetia bacterium]
MDFGKIYEEWEKGRGTNKKLKVHQELEDWLDTNSIPPEVMDGRDEEAPHPSRLKAARRAELRRMEPEDSIDLHGMTAEEAVRTLAGFLETSRKRGLRKVLVIHGRGLHSRESPVLPGRVRDFLKRSAVTGEYGYADKRHGGSGATWVVLRQRSR